MQKRCHRAESKRRRRFGPRDLKAQLAPLAAIVGLEQLGLSELNSALVRRVCVSARQGDKGSAETVTTPPTGKRVRPLSVGQLTLTHCPTGTPSRR